MRIKLDVTTDKLADLLCSAIEGGSNYWYVITDKIEPNKWHYFEDFSNEKFLHLYPFNLGGALMINDDNSDEPTLKQAVKLDIAQIRKGMELWAIDAQKPDSDKTRQAHPHYFYDFLQDNYDDETADVFLQFCIFGKVIYG